MTESEGCMHCSDAYSLLTLLRMPQNTFLLSFYDVPLALSFHRYAIID